jgi:hypothetical protein
VCALSLALTALTFLLITLNLSLNAPIFFYWFESTIEICSEVVDPGFLEKRGVPSPVNWKKRRHTDEKDTSGR